MTEHQQEEPSVDETQAERLARMIPTCPCGSTSPRPATSTTDDQLAAVCPDCGRTEPIEPGELAPVGAVIRGTTDHAELPAIRPELNSDLEPASKAGYSSVGMVLAGLGALVFIRVSVDFARNVDHWGDDSQPLVEALLLVPLAMNLFAYLADWRAGGEANSIAKWIERAAQDFARLTPQQRGPLIPEAAPRAADGTVTGKPRSYTVAEDAAEAIAQAMAADQEAGRWDSESAWLRGAMARAVEAARRREGGELPQAPARLPARLTRA